MKNECPHCGGSGVNLHEEEYIIGSWKSICVRCIKCGHRKYATAGEAIPTVAEEMIDINSITQNEKKSRRKR